MKNLKRKSILMVLLAFVAFGLGTLGAPNTVSAEPRARIMVGSYEAYDWTREEWTPRKLEGLHPGDQIVFRFTAKSTGPATGQVQVRFSADTGRCLFFEDFFVFNTLEYVSGDLPDVTLEGNPTSADFPVGEHLGTPLGEWVATYNVTFEAAGEARIYHILQLSSEAGECRGLTHSRLMPAIGGVQRMAGHRMAIRVE